ESIVDSVTTYKKSAHTCYFENQISDMLRDCFVMGLANESTQHLLLEEKELTFNKAKVKMELRHRSTPFSISKVYLPELVAYRHWTP
ncbi:hypothetical protein SK128_020461, partial [Halocaridina rubra]